MDQIKKSRKPSVIWLMAGVLLQAWIWRQIQRKRHLQRAACLSRAKPPPVQTWEGEGGALRATGAQLGPDPSSTPASTTTPPTPTWH